MYSILEAVELVTRCDLKLILKDAGVSSLDVTQPNQQKWHPSVFGVSPTWMQQNSGRERYESVWNLCRKICGAARFSCLQFDHRLWSSASSARCFWCEIDGGLIQQRTWAETVQNPHIPWIRSGWMSTWSPLRWSIEYLIPLQIKGTKEHNFVCFGLKMYHQVASSGVLSGTLSKANAGVGARVQVQARKRQGTAVPNVFIGIETPLCQLKDLQPKWSTPKIVHSSRLKRLPSQNPLGALLGGSSQLVSG